MQVAFIGMGTMGLPMSLNLLQAGFDLTVYNRTRDRVEPAVQAGAKTADSPQVAAANADIIIICVSDTADVEHVILGEHGIIQGAQPGAIVVDMSTISPTVTRQLAAALAVRDVKMLDAPVSGGSEGAKNGTLSIMVGGDAAALGTVRPVLAAMGTTITHIGPIGSGQLTKAINQIIVAGVYAAVAEGMVFGLKAGLDMDNVLAAVGSGAAASWTLTNRSRNMLNNEYPLGFRLRLHRKDLAIALDAAKEMGVALPTAAYLEQLENALIARGFGDEDMSVVARTWREQAGL